MKGVHLFYKINFRSTLIDFVCHTDYEARHFLSKCCDKKLSNLYNLIKKYF